MTACNIPPEGWYCTRQPGHDGPCAAWPTEGTVAAIMSAHVHVLAGQTIVDSGAAARELMAVMSDYGGWPLNAFFPADTIRIGALASLLSEATTANAVGMSAADEPKATDPAVIGELVLALERIAADGEPYRSGYCQTDITVDPALTAQEAQDIAHAALAKYATQEGDAS